MNNPESKNNISDPRLSKLNYNFVTFYNLTKGNSIGPKGDIRFVNLIQKASNIESSIKSDNTNTYYGIINKAEYTFNIDFESSAYPSSRLTLYKANKGNWDIVKTVEKASISENITYDSYINVKLIGFPMNIYTNFYEKEYPILFNSNSVENKGLKIYNIGTSYSDNVEKAWPLYILNKKDQKCGTKELSDIPQHFMLDLGLSNTELNTNECLKPYTKGSIKASTIGMAYYNTSKGSNSICGLYDRENKASNDTFNFSPITPSSTDSSIFLQWDTKKDDIYLSKSTIYEKGYNTFGLKMSLSNNLLIAGTPIKELIQYNDENDSYEYFEKGDGIIKIYDISSASNINNNELLEIQDMNLIDCTTHYSIFGTSAQNYILFSTDDTINNPLIKATSINKGPQIYQFIENGGTIIPYMNPPINNELILKSDYYNGFSLDFMEGISDSYQLNSIIGNIPKDTNNKGNIYIAKNEYNSKQEYSTLTKISDQYSIPFYEADNFGSKVKTIYINNDNIAYIMAINRISYKSKTNRDAYSSAHLLYYDINDSNSKIKSIDYVELKGKQIIDASATVCDGDDCNSRIVYYLSVSDIKSYDNNFKYYYNIYNSTYKGENAPPRNIIQYEFNIKDISVISKSSKVYQSFANSNENPYELYNRDVQQKLLSNSSTLYFKPRSSYLFGGSVDVVNANVKLPYKGLERMYRTNFLLTNKKYQGIKGIDYNLKGNIFNSTTIYCDRVIEELTHKANYFKSNNFTDFYKGIYKKEIRAMTNIELFTYQLKGNKIDNFNNKSMWNYGSNVVYSNDLSNVEVINNCEFELPQHMAISNNYFQAVQIKSSDLYMVKGSTIVIYKKNDKY